MSGQETFQFAAAVAGVSIGLAAALILAVLAVIGTWRLFRHATEASEAAARAALSIEDLARRITAPNPAEAVLPQIEALAHEVRRLPEQLRSPIDSAALANLAQEVRQLQEQLRTMMESTAVENGSSLALDALEASVGRLDATVGQMATSVANLIQTLERQQRR